MQRLELFDLKMVSKIAQMSAMYEPIQGISMPDLSVTHRIRRAKIIFSMFLTFFEYAESIMPSGAKLNYLCKGSKNYDWPQKMASKITQQEH